MPSIFRDNLITSYEKFQVLWTSLTVVLFSLCSELFSGCLLHFHSPSVPYSFTILCIILKHCFFKFCLLWNFIKMVAKCLYSSVTSLFHSTIFFEYPPRLMYTVIYFQCCTDSSVWLFHNSLIEHFCIFSMFDGCFCLFLLLPTRLPHTSLCMFYVDAYV